MLLEGDEASCFGASWRTLAPAMSMRGVAPLDKQGVRLGEEVILIDGCGMILLEA
jgi:hypothetical protein